MNEGRFSMFDNEASLRTKSLPKMDQEQYDKQEQHKNKIR